MSRWLVVGAAGMLGQDLVTALGQTPGAREVTAVDATKWTSSIQTPVSRSCRVLILWSMLARGPQLMKPKATKHRPFR